MQRCVDFQETPLTSLKSPRLAVWLVLLAAAGTFALTMGTRQTMGLFLSPLNTSTGLGLGSASVIPEVETDFIFAAVFHEFGLVFGILVILMYLMIFLRGVGVARRARSRFHTLLALGCSCFIAVQTFIIIGGNINLIPLTGVTLPFMSYGGTSMVSSLCIMGLLQGVANANEQGLEEDQLIALLGEDD